MQVGSLAPGGGFPRRGRDERTGTRRIHLAPASSRFRIIGIDGAGPDLARARRDARAQSVDRYRVRTLPRARRSRRPSRDPPRGYPLPIPRRVRAATRGSVQDPYRARARIGVRVGRGGARNCLRTARMRGGRRRLAAHAREVLAADRVCGAARNAYRAASNALFVLVLRAAGASSVSRAERHALRDAGIDARGLARACRRPRSERDHIVGRVPRNAPLVRPVALGESRAKAASSIAPGSDEGTHELRIALIRERHSRNARGASRSGARDRTPEPREHGIVCRGPRCRPRCGCIFGVSRRRALSASHVPRPRRNRPIDGARGANHVGHAPCNEPAADRGYAVRVTAVLWGRFRGGSSRRAGGRGELRAQRGRLRPGSGVHGGRPSGRHCRHPVRGPRNDDPNDAAPHPAVRFARRSVCARHFDDGAPTLNAGRFSVCAQHADAVAVAEWRGHLVCRPFARPPDGWK